MLLVLENLNLCLGNKHVLRDIQLHIPVKGEIIGIMGPNGAGKSSLIKSMIGEFNATGRQTLDGKPIQDQLKSITYIPQKSYLDLDFPINVETVILSGAYKEVGWFKRVPADMKQRLNTLLHDLKLEPLRNRQISELSGGQLQRVLVARALMTDSRVYLLDEPFVGIDYLSESLIMDKLNDLRAKDRLILIVHHDLSKAKQYFDRALLLNQTVRFLGDLETAMQPEYINATFISSTTTEEPSPSIKEREA